MTGASGAEFFDHLSLREYAGVINALGQRKIGAWGSALHAATLSTGRFYAVSSPKSNSGDNCTTQNFVPFLSSVLTVS